MKFLEKFKKRMLEMARERKQRTERKSKVKHRLKLKKEIFPKHRLKFYLEKAGIDTDPHKLSKTIFNICIGINLLITAYLLYFFSTQFGYTLGYVIVVMALLWVVVFVGLIFIIWLLFHLALDLRIFQRRVTIEQVLPDYLLIASANIRSGMAIDKALWYAVRPRFGVLANDIELVAKQTMSGEDLSDALTSFAEKYDSPLLKRTVSLLIEGIEAGGEIGGLLNNISHNIKENQILRQEMSANVTSYAIFISFASVLAAPFLFALSLQLLTIVRSIMGSLPPQGAGAATFGISIGAAAGGGVNPADFTIFAYVSLLLTSYFSASIVATIKKGSVKQGYKYIPTFMVLSITLFLVFSKLLANLLGGLF